MSAIAHYCLHKLYIRPSELLTMDKQELAFIIASIDKKVENERKEVKKIEHY